MTHSQTAATAERRVVETAGLLIRVAPGEDSVCTMQLTGELDVAAASIVDGELCRLRPTIDRTLVIDLSELEFIDSIGIQTLVEASRWAAADGFRLGLRGANGQVERVLELTGLRDELPFLD